MMWLENKRSHRPFTGEDSLAILKSAAGAQSAAATIAAMYAYSCSAQPDVRDMSPERAV